MRISELKEGDTFTTLHRTGCIAWRSSQEVYRLTRKKNGDWGFIAVSDGEGSSSYGIAMDIKVFKTVG